VKEERLVSPWPASDMMRQLRGLCTGGRAIVLTATALEAAPFLSTLKVRRTAAVAGVSLSVGDCLPECGQEHAIRVVVAVTGCDKVNVAHALTLLLAVWEGAPQLVVQTGVAGAFEGSGLEPGDVVVASEEAYSDTGSSSPQGWLSARDLRLPIATIAGKEAGGVFSLDRGLVEKAVMLLEAASAGAGTRHLVRVVSGRCVTSSRVTGTKVEADLIRERWQALAESMEGAAAAHVCALHQVPFLELRGISNLVTDRDRAAWRLEQGADAAAWAARVVLERLDDLTGGLTSRTPLAGTTTGCGVGLARLEGTGSPTLQRSGQRDGRRSGQQHQRGNATTLRLAFSPCPNDTFIFHAWVEGLVEGAPPVETVLADIDVLNRLAQEGAVDVVKVSLAAFAQVRDRYALLHCGGALGRGVGPLVVARKDSLLRPALSSEGGAALADELSRVRVALPGNETTAALLARAFAGELKRAVIMPFDRIMPAVAAGEVEAGVIIHEGRFTFASYGLRQLIDLGEWWETGTGLPVPLGGIAVARSLDREVQRAVEEALRASILMARAHPGASREYVRTHAQEMDPLVCQAHIDLYVNDFTVDYGPEGEAAIERLLALVRSPENEEGETLPLFWDGDRGAPVP